MKKILIILLVSSWLSANAQTNAKESETDSVEVQIVQLPDSTAIGTPTGKKISKEIGAAGGTIVSDDGKVELIFPADALTKATEISIQPITNLIPNGNKAYQFEPSGIQFQKPVQIVFHYSDQEVEACPPEFKFMALQDHKGKWEYLYYDNWDSTTKSLTGSISHFSAFVDGNEVELNNTEITLKVGTPHQFALNVVQPPAPPATPGEDELPPLPITIRREDRDAVWKVNNRTGGTANHGTIVPEKEQQIKATYKAPDVLTADPITVKLELSKTTIREVVQRSRGARGWRGTTRIPTTKKLGTFACNVKLYDEYKITILKKGSSGLICGAKLEDKSSFNVRLYSDNKRPDISDEENGPPTLTKQANCGYLKYDPAGCHGPVHINKNLLFGHGILYDQGAVAAAPEITLEFAITNVKIMNQKDKAPNELHHFGGEEVLGVTVGNKIKFKANRLKQDISVGGGAQMSYQLIIDPL